MDINEIEEMWNKDSHIDIDDLQQEAIDIPKLHSKYYQIHNKIYMVKKLKEAEYNSLHYEKTMYFSGKAPPEVLEKKPLELRIVKADVPFHVNNDPEIVKAKARVDYCNYMLAYIADILKMIHNRSFQIRDSIEFLKFNNGAS